MKETGRILREARETQNISLAAVSAVTKINIKVLEAIESAQMENLPSKTFLRGFVQTYANFLKLSPSEVLELFHKEMGTTKYTPSVTGHLTDGQTIEEGAAQETAGETKEAPVAAAPAPSPVARREEDEGLAYANGGRSMTSKIVFAVLAAALIAGIYVVSEVVQKYQRESQLPENTPEIEGAVVTEPVNTGGPDSSAATNAAKPGDTKTGEAKTDTKPGDAKPGETKPADAQASGNKPSETKPTDVKAADTNAAAKPTDAKPGDVKATEAKPVEQKATEQKLPEKKLTETKPAETKPVDAKPVEQKTTEQKLPEKKPETAATTPATEQKPVPPANPQDVVIEALDAVKIDYRIDGGVLQSVTLQPEEKRSFKARREVKMDVSDGGAVSVNHNGKDKGVPGNLGQPMKLSFP